MMKTSSSLISHCQLYASVLEVSEMLDCWFGLDYLYVWSVWGLDWEQRVIIWLIITLGFILYVIMYVSLKPFCIFGPPQMKLQKKNMQS